MKTNCSTYINCYSFLTCVVLIALPVLIIFSKSEFSEIINSENKKLVPVSMKLHNNASALTNQEDSDDFSGSSKSSRNPINQNKTSYKNLKKTEDQTKRNSSEILLYRKRRYLLFPEGSSFQLVFDLIIPIVTYTNYAIMGVTCAVAWELPSKAPSEIENDLVDKLNDGTLGISRNDSINDIKYVDTPHRQKPAQDQLSNIYYIQPSEYQSYPAKVTVNSHSQMYSNDRMDYTNYHKYIPGPVYVSNQQNRPVYYTNSYNNSPFKLKSINNERIDERPPSERIWNSNYSKRPTLDELSNEPSENTQPRPRQNNYSKPRQHAVYHIMGKRSIHRGTELEDTNPLLDKLDRIHLRYHRSSRHTLYSKIEVVFNKQGKNGTECVLRALCETGQRRHEVKPKGMLVEILRAVFTLPEADDEIRTKESNPKHKIWDEAHGNPKNCSETYPLCDNFIWNSKYIF